MAVKNMAASVLTRLKNQSKVEGVSFQMVLQLFVQEEFLRRLSVSKYVENLILKGGMFIYMLTEFNSRPTRDIDFLLRNLQGSLENIEYMMRDICSISSGNDFITLEVLGLETISVDKKYPGVKASFMGRINSVRIPFSIDVGIDDVIVPEPVKRRFATRLLDFDSPYIYTYSLESTIAEKFDAILRRMAGTSRMKDFYDIYYLSGIFDFDGKTLAKAMNTTLNHRKRELMKDAFIDIDDFRENVFLLTQWRAFEPARATELAFADVIDRLKLFLEPLYQSVLQGIEYNRQWDCESKQWI